jgi:hypothetical protein
MLRYLCKISGPLLGRIDIHIEVTPVPFEKLSEERKGEGSVAIRKRVTEAREIETKRFTELENVHYNAQMNTKQIREHCQLDEPSKQLLKKIMAFKTLKGIYFKNLNLPIHRYFKSQIAEMLLIQITLGFKEGEYIACNLRKYIKCLIIILTIRFESHLGISEKTLNFLLKVFSLSQSIRFCLLDRSRCSGNNSVKV